MMPFGLARRYQLIAHAHGKRQIGPSAAVKVAQFTSPDAKLDPAEPVRGDRHVRPRGNFSNDPLFNALPLRSAALVAGAPRV